ncbi:MAG: TerC family protein [Acidobacteriaceae bacterium]|nr:TerC family protein [Acidobacteriaceae bacterium]
MTPSIWRFAFTVASIVVVDLTLSGDNALVIAAAAKSLPRDVRRRALVAGGLCAAAALVVATFFATHMLNVKFLQIAGGVMILWIAAGLFRDEPPLKSPAEQTGSFWKAMWFILVADVTMSTDNILAVAAIAQGNFALILFGLGISIPLVVFASGLLAKLMEKFPLIVYLGAGLLGRVAGRMILTDAFIVKRFAPPEAWVYAAEALGAAGVLLTGLWMKSRS